MNWHSSCLLDLIRWDVGHSPSYDEGACKGYRPFLSRVPLRGFGYQQSAGLGWQVQPEWLPLHAVLTLQRMCSVIDYGAGWFDLNWAFSQQRAMNPPGKSPAMCSEF